MAFNCELSIIKAKNIEIKSNALLFVRCYLYAGKNTRIKLNTKEISSNSPLFWNQNFSLECSGNNNIYNTLSQSSVVFELRKGVTVPIIGKIRKSILLARAEVPWRSVCETKGTEVEKWIFMSAKKRWVSHEDVKPPAVQIAMKLVGVLPTEETAQEKRRRQQREAECDGVCECSSCCNCNMFASAEGCEAF